MTTAHVRSPFSQIFLGAAAGIALIAVQTSPTYAQVQSGMAEAAQKVLTPAEKAKIAAANAEAAKVAAARAAAAKVAAAKAEAVKAAAAKQQALKNRDKGVGKPAPAPAPKVIVKKPVTPGAPAKVIVKTPGPPGAPAKVIVKTPPVPTAPAKIIVKTPVSPGAPAKVIVKTPAQPAPAVVVQPQGAPVVVQQGVPPRGRRWQPAVRQISRPVPGSLTPKGVMPANTPLVVRMAKQPQNLIALKQQRSRTFDKANNRVIIKEPGNRVIVRQNNKSVIVKNDSDRIARVAKTRSITRSDGTNVTIIQRPNNNSVYNVTDTNGQLVRRYRRNAQGQEHNIIDNRRRDKFGRNLALGVGIGVGVVAGAVLLHSLVDMPPPRVDVPRRKYIVDYDQANDDDVYEAFSAPPVERLERRYTLDEVRATPRLRERMRRVDLNDINFETGSWEVEESQYNKLERVARAMMRVIEQDPNEVFMIEGYTDAVGAENDNLTLSDRRAESVAVILTEQFQVPPENLTTQGFGEEYLKVETDGPERLNRRVAARRITPLLSQNEGDEAPQQ